MTASEVAAGDVGEICCKGAHVMQGYWNKPEASAEALRGGWLHTGDLGYVDADGFVFVVDRLKDMIITGGENVYSAEVENALSKHPAVAASAVIGVPDETVWRARARRRGSGAGAAGHGGRAGSALQGAHCRVQGAAQLRVPGGAAHVRGRQDPQARAARQLRRGTELGCSEWAVRCRD